MIIKKYCHLEHEVGAIVLRRRKISKEKSLQLMRFFANAQNDHIYKKGENMTEKEKTASILLIISMIILIISSWYTIFQIRPDYILNIQNTINKLKK